MRLRKHLSFANVMSLIAVCIAIGGTAYAANKISGKSIKNNTIAKKKLKKNVLKGLDTCPSGATNYTNGICYSGQFAPNDWDVAARDCANKGLRLPDRPRAPWSAIRSANDAYPPSGVNCGSSARFAT